MNPLTQHPPPTPFRTVLVLGGTSDISHAVTARLDPPPTTVILAGRHPHTLTAAATTLQRTGMHVHTASFDATDLAGHARLFTDLWAQYGAIDLVILAAGVLGNPDDCRPDPTTALEVITTNYVGATSALLHLTPHLVTQGHGTVIILSSIAAQLPRAKNPAYSSSKAGLDHFSQSLADQLAGTGVRLLIVRPGHVTTTMTAHLPTPRHAVHPANVADAIHKALHSHKRIVWAPNRLRWPAALLQHLPPTLRNRLLP
ncbi:SDR family NAD(P)-dependent oxidoreductase [Streptomyces sp. NPDC047028]|uniref:SDR family NAD(P)-dependent oxidoreductase n=1 Tax=Streptomyces sp. NPDC047028 TaxID=3155793 RepID=UPI0033E3374D